MVFSSLEFIFIFLTLFLPVYYITPQKHQNAILFIASLLFFSYGNIKHPAYITLMLLTICVNFIIGECIGTSCGSRSKIWLILGLTFNFFWLFLFKYLDFVLENVNLLLAHSGSSFSVPLTGLVLPVGISFYTFQISAYLIDVYRKSVPHENSLIDLGTYLCMFPQLIAGPIISYPQVRTSIKKRTISLSDIEDGLKTFVIGLGMKVLLANQLAGLWSDIGTIGYESISTQLAWLGIIAYSLQIYFDFYGYSLMAIGLGKLIGFTLPENFRHPYTALTMTDFWRRWHITLSSWFRDYIYIPLGGSRAGVLKTLRNTAFVWLFTGIWHGASWNFLLWGMVLFALIITEKAFLGKILNRFPLLGRLYMCLVIPVSWLIFAITDLRQLHIYFLKLFPFLGNAGNTPFAQDYLKYAKLYAVSLITGLLFSTTLPKRLYEKHKNTLSVLLLLLAVFWACIYCMYIGMDDPFLYFRF